MDRRKFLALSTIGALAGCSGGASEESSGGETTTTAPEATASGAGGAHSVGETVTTENGIATTVDEVSLANEISTVNGSFRPEEGKRFGLVRISAQNTADSPRDLPTPPEIVLVTGGTQFKPEEVEGRVYGEELGRLETPVSGEFYEAIEGARPTVSASGWLLYQVPMQTESARISWARTAYTDEGEITRSAEWDVPFNPEALPNLQIEGIDAPETAHHHKSANVVIEIANTGGMKGVFEGVITSEVLEEEIPVSVSLNPGETTTIAVTIPYPEFFGSGEQSATFNLREESFKINYQSPTLDMGEKVRFPSNLVLQVSQLRRIDYFETEGPYGDRLTERPGDGMQFFAFVFTAINEGEQTLGRVSPADLSIFDGDRLDTRLPLGLYRETVYGQISGHSFGVLDQLPPGERREGWAVIEVTQNLGEEATLEYQNAFSDYGSFTPRWRL